MWIRKKTRKPLQKLGCSLIGNDDLLLMLKKVPKILNEKDNSNQICQSLYVYGKPPL